MLEVVGVRRLIGDESDGVFGVDMVLEVGGKVCHLVFGRECWLAAREEEMVKALEDDKD